MIYEFVAPCYFGTERSAAFDFKRIGAQEVTVTDGRVSFKGDERVLAAANIESRCAERILLLLRRARTASFDELFDSVFSVPWESLLPANAEFPVKGASLSSKLSSVPACQSIVKKAVVERLKKGHHVNVLPEDGELYKIRFSIRKDVMELFLDTSGDGLHKRGYRARSTLAPIKETLASVIVDLARVRADSLVQDPFCGSGTLIIEAAQKALRIAPGLRRKFLAEHYAFISPKAWQEARERALSEIDRTGSFEGIGFDLDPHAVELANRNAALAGVGDRCKFFTADVANFTPASRSLVITNPPYGERLGDLEQAGQLERTLAARLQENPVAGTYVITADADFEHNFGKKASRRRKLYNGMIPCQLYMYF